MWICAAGRDGVLLCPLALDWDPQREELLAQELAGRNKLIALCLPGETMQLPKGKVSSSLT